MSDQLTHLRRKVDRLEAELASRPPKTGFAEEHVSSSSVARYQKLFAAVSDALMIFDIETKQFCEVNEAALQLYGYTREEFLGLTHADITAEPEASVDSFNQLLAGDISRIPLRYHKKRDGTRFPVEITATVISESDQVFFCGVVRDLTEKLAVESELAESHTTLEQRVKDRTVELEQANIDLLSEISIRKRAEQLIQAVVEGTASETGAEFFPSLARALARVFGSRYILVCENLDSPVSRVQTLAFWVENDLVKNIEYDLSGGPCEVTAAGEYTYYPNGLQDLFPEDKDLVEMGAESYCGIPLSDAEGRMIGHLAILDDRPMDQNLCETPALQVFVARAAAELERKRIEQALRESELRLKTVIRSAPVVITSVNQRGEIDLFDGKALESVGFAPGYLEGRDYFEVWKDRPSLTSSIQKCLSGETPDSTVTEVAGRVLETRFAPIHSLEDKVTGAISVCTDITDKWTAEKALRESEQRLSLVTDSLPAFISYLGADLRYKFVNKYYEDRLGIPREKIIGQHLSEVLGEENYASIRAYAEKVLQGNRVQYEEQLYFKDLGTRMMSVEYVPDVGDQGKVLGYFTLASDITDQLRAKEQLQSQRDQLAHVSRVSAMGEMATGLAHELNQPLSAIATYAYTVQELVRKGDSDSLGKISQAMVDQSLRAGEIVRRMRQFVSKGGSERHEIEVGQVVEDVCQLLEPELKLSRVSPIRHLETPGQRILVDEIQIQQVLVNLIRNAIDATKDQAAERRVIHIYSKASDNQKVEIAVKDAGCGLSHEQRNKVFDAFYSTKESGMGVGLSISRSIIENHGGRLWVEDNDDHGVTFRFTMLAGDQHEPS